MLNRPVNQAAGLLSIAEHQHTLRLMAMSSHGDEPCELPLLWRLCSSIAGFGYSVIVLDETTHESATNPGLAQMMEYGTTQSSNDFTGSEWVVVPSAIGLQSLCAAANRVGNALPPLGHLFPHASVVLIYGGVTCLTALLSGTSIKPLLVVTQERASLINSYRALKQLLLHGKLEPTIVSLVTNAQPHVTNFARGSVATSLSECARTFLGYEVNALQIEAPSDDDRPCAKLQRLALTMLENAVTLGSNTLNLVHLPGFNNAGLIARRH